MKIKKKVEAKPEQAETLPELCAAVREVRNAYDESEEQFARRVELAGQTVSRFERGRQIPTDFHVLKRLAASAQAMGLAKETELFEQAARQAIVRLGEIRSPLASVPIHS